MKLVSSSIKSLLAEPAGIQKAYEDYTQLFIGPNSLPAPLWESVYLDREIDCLRNKHCFLIKKVFESGNEEKEDDLWSSFIFL
ncbi:molecular chaperone TorD family protein [Bacillus atrophaeus]|uniref:molecular chaperone TorD family protein n=2 Tax=Bacillus atrophaeus TaxID=1452 RepID=UPI00255BC896|nr:molecular chaperone TorD family protein [Bacillus atrophaeus]